MTPLPQSPGRPARRWRWLLVVAILVVSVVCLPPVLLALWGPSLLGGLLSTRLHTAVTVQRVTGGWWSQVGIQGLTIAESAVPQAPPSVQIERIAANVTLLPLLLSTKPVRLHIDQVGVYLRQQPDGQWNLAVLANSSTSEASASPSPQGPPILPNRQVEVTMTHGSLRLGPDGPVYTFEGQAGSPSLVEASVQWRVALAGPEGATLTAHGQLDNLLGAAPLTGHLDVSVSQLDLALVRALVPAAGALQPHGQIQAAHLRLMQTAAHGLSIDASLELQQVTWQNMPQAAGEGLAHVQVRLQVRWQGSQWACDALTVHVPGGHFALRDPAWLQADETAWRGQMSFTLDVEDTQPVTQALAGLLPATLHLGGRLRVAGEVGGEVSRMPILSWDARLAGLRVALDGSLASARWEQVVMTEIVAKYTTP